MLKFMAEPDLPELEDIRRIVLDQLLPGHHLKSVEITVGTLVEGQEPQFTVLIGLSEDPDADPDMSYHEITSRIRERWSRDDLYVKIHCEDSKAGEDFTVTFSPDLSPEQIAAALSALADYYRACGGVGFKTGFELQTVSVRQPVYAR